MSKLSSSMISFSYSRLIFKWLGVLNLVFTLSMNAQIIDNRKAKVWLRAENYINSSTDLAEGTIGNYPAFADSSNILKQGLEEISKARTGTLFFVLKTGRREASLDPLLKVGSIKLFTDSAVVFNRPVLTDPIREEACIVMVTYQGRADRPFNKGQVWIEDSLIITEVIFYDFVLSAEEARIVESYLAMKYSINITANKKEELRNYIDVFGNKAWNIKTDEPYDEEVLALGRVDKIDFYQTQTFTSDSRAIRIAFDLNSELTKMPGIQIEDESLLLLSKKKATPKEDNCGSSIFNNPWKLKFMNWKSGATHFYITFDTLLTSVKEVTLTDGDLVMDLHFQLLDQSSLLSIPIPNSVDLADKTFYLSWTGANQNCLPSCFINLPNCEDAKLRISISEETLPAEIELVNIDTKATLKTTVETEYSYIENLLEGYYQLNIFNKDFELADQIFFLGECSNHPSMARLDNDSMRFVAVNDNDLKRNELYISNEIGIKNVGSEEDFSSFIQIIKAYPNPARPDQDVEFDFYGLNDTKFLIEILDSKGRLLDRREFTPVEKNPVLKYKFRKDGSYLVRFSSNQFSDVKHMVIN